MKKLFILLFVGLCFAFSVCAGETNVPAVEYVGPVDSFGSTAYSGETLVVSQGETISKDLQKLINIAEDKYAWFRDRTNAIKKIAEKGNKTAIPALIKLSKSEIGSVRVAANNALIKLKAIPENKQKVDGLQETKQKIKIVSKKEVETDPLKSLNNTLLFQTERRDPATACFLSMATLGGGQIYNYQPYKAIVAYIISGLSLIGIFSNNQIGIVIGEVALLGTWTWSVFDSYNSAVDINIQMEKKYKIGISFRY